MGNGRSGARDHEWWQCGFHRLSVGETEQRNLPAQRLICCDKSGDCPKTAQCQRRWLARKQKFQINPLYAPQEVSILDIPFDAYLAPGSILIDSDNKFLYFILDADTARRYGVAIGKEGLGWYGTANVKEKVEWPSWIPTAEMMERDPDKYLSHKDGIPGGPGNPLGARAIYLFQGDEDTHIRIHGTTQPWTIGKAASNGCFRMVNDHVIDLYNRVQIGAQVIVI